MNETILFVLLLATILMVGVAGIMNRSEPKLRPVRISTTRKHRRSR